MKPEKVYACYNKDKDVRLSSSSGAVFSSLAEYVLNKNGIVYGVAMSKDCYSAEFIAVTDGEGLTKLRGSKYLQAKVGDTFKKVKAELQAGNLVLFTGTGCQVNGLKKFLGNDYDNLICMDVICHGGSTHIEGLQKLVVEKGLDVGFAYDGDADRCLCVDEKGNVITGDHILYIYGCYMKERGKLLNNTVVTTVMSNFGLYKAFDEQGIGYAKTAVGDKYVYEYMVKNDCRIGGEQSGHIIFSKYASTGDGILTSLKMMEVMLAKKKPMSELTAPLKIYPQVLENIRVTDKKAAQNDPAVQEAVSRVAEALGDTGRILVRESGTEPVVRVMVEAPDHDTCQKYVDEVVNVICEKGYKA